MSFLRYQYNRVIQHARNEVFESPFGDTWPEIVFRRPNSSDTQLSFFFLKSLEPVIVPDFAHFMKIVLEDDEYRPFSFDGGNCSVRTGMTSLKKR